MTRLAILVLLAGCAPVTPECVDDAPICPGDALPACQFGELSWHGSFGVCALAGVYPGPTCVDGEPVCPEGSALVCIPQSELNEAPRSCE